MNEQSSPLPPDHRTDNRATPPPPAPRTPFALRLAVLAALALLTLNVWMLARAVRWQQTGSREHAFWTLCQPGSTAAARERAFTRLAADGHREWRSAQLHELNLAGVLLPGADLRAAFFIRTTFTGANLARARLGNSSLEEADLSGADLSQADLAEAQLLRAILNRTRLRRANLRAASLEQVQAENADLALADLSDANCLMANLTGARLDGANLSGARLEAAVLKDARLTLARLEDANLEHADLTGANWWRARGLKTGQLELFRQQFPPGDTAAPALKADYAQWLQEISPKPSAR